jgi:hypothetical protein
VGPRTCAHTGTQHARGCCACLMIVVSQPLSCETCMHLPTSVPRVALLPFSIAHTNLHVHVHIRPSIHSRSSRSGATLSQTCGRRCPPAPWTASTLWTGSSCHCLSECAAAVKLNSFCEHLVGPGFNRQSASPQSCWLHTCGASTGTSQMVPVLATHTLSHAHVHPYAGM